MRDGKDQSISDSEPGFCKCMAAVLDHSPHLIWVVSPGDYRVAFLCGSPGLLVDLTGAGNDSVPAGTVLWDAAPLLREALEPAFEAVAASGEECRLSTLRTDRNGEPRFWDVFVTPLYPEREEPAPLLCAVLTDVTGRADAEEALRQSQQMLQLVLDAIPVRVFWKDRDSVLIGCNRPFASDAGAESPEEIIGKTDYEMGWREQADLYRADDRIVMESGLPKLNYEEPQTTPEGATIWLRTSKIPLRDGSGQVIGVLGTYEDISERKEAEAALKQSKEWFQSLVETTSDWIWEVDARCVYTYASPRVKDLLGYDPSEVLGKSPFDLMPAEEAARLLPIVRRHFDLAKPITGLRNWNQHRNGGLVLLETNGLPMFDDTGHLTGFRGVDRDITEIRRTEQALRESEYRYAAAQRAAKLGSWDWDILTGELHWSEEIEPMFGFERGQFGGSYDAFFARIHPDDRQRVTDSVDAAVRQGREYDIEHRVVWPDGTTRWVSEKGEVHRDRDGKPVRMLGIVQDITDRKLAEEERERLLRQIDEAKETAQRQFTLLQEALLPVEPSIGEGYGIAAAFLPAAPGQQIGGDFYDVFPTEKRYTGVLVGDVTGKDVSAAALAARTRSTIRAFAYEMDSPGRALTHSNAVICGQQADLESFVTVFLAVIDPPTGLLRYSVAGHPPPAVRRSDGSVEFLEWGALPVAVQPDHQYAERSMTLNPGDKLVVYTDGISEAHHGGDLFDLEGIERTLAKCGHAGPERIIEELIDAARDWSGGRLTDDIAIVVIERVLAA